MELILVALISLPLSVITNIMFIQGVIHTPPQMTYLGVTHHFQDYFAYLSQVMQGVNGLWLTQDLYTTEKTIAAPAYWMNILIGHISRIVHGNPIYMYNMSVFILVFLMLIFSYFFFKKIFQTSRLGLIAFLFFVFSNSTYNPPALWPFELWGTPHLMFMRLSTLPHHLIQTILFLAILLLLFDEKQKLRPWIRNGLLALCTVLLTLLQPIMVGMLTGSVLVTKLFFEKQKQWGKILSLSIAFLFSFTLMFFAFQGEPHIQLRLWEKTQQTLTTTLFLLLSIGPILPFAIVGMWVTIKKQIPIGITGLFLVIGGYILFRFPLLDQTIGMTNVRVVFPGTILFLAYFATLAVMHLSRKKPLVEALCVLLFLLAVAPTVVWEIQKKINPVGLNTPIQHIPTSTMKAYTFLKKTSPYTNVVLGNPETYTNYLIPALSGHVSISGHPLLTINADEKNAKAKAFFTHTMDETTALNWLAQERVTYVIFTNGDGSKEAFEETYPFLTTVFSTPTASVYQIHR